MVPVRIFAALCLAACALSLRARSRVGHAGADARIVQGQRLLWLGAALFFLALGLVRVTHLVRAAISLAHHLARGLGLHGVPRAPAAGAAVLALLFVLGATYAVLRATRSAPWLRGTLILAGLLALLAIGSSASFRLRLLLMEPVGPATARDILEIWMVAVASALAARAGGASAVGTRSAALSMAIAFVVPISFLAGARAFRARPIAAVVNLGPGIADAVGGGFTAAGLWGDYFGNPGFAGPPAFYRRDVRIDFDWGLAGRPGGSTSPGFDAVGHDGFSVRWTGRIVARFGEPYTFDVDSDDDVRLWLRNKGSERWIAVVDRRRVDAAAGAGAAGHVASVPVQLTAGVPVEIKLEYRRSSGPARVRLFWASPSTPREIIEPLSASGVNVAGLPGYVGYLGSALLADAMKGGRRQWTEPDRDGLVPLDRDGWPLRDSDNITIEGGTQTRGTYQLSFAGRADVSTFPPVSFAVGGRRYKGLLPSGSGYDARTNTTRAAVSVEGDTAVLVAKFRRSQRNATAPIGSGVRDVRLMRPISPGSSTSYPAGTLFAHDLEAFLESFTTLRWILNFDTEARWEERTRPSGAKAMRDTEPPIWEHVVMLANETGRDLFVSTPINATEDYLARLARLIRFGTDAAGEPYRADVPHPAHPPLNSNLRLYVERSNETWNWSFSQARTNERQVEDAVARQTPDGQIVDFDGVVPASRGAELWVRWHALQTKRVSDIFRQVFGQGAMGNRVRILYEYQYDNYQATASEGLLFLERYFDNADGEQHVPDPRPVSAYLWGAGAATYYGSANPAGAVAGIVVPDGGFEKPKETSSWKFQGESGVYRTPALAEGIRLRDAGRASPSPGVALGVRFSVGERPLAVYELGRLAGPDDKQSHAVSILRADDRAVVASAEIAPRDGRNGRPTFARLPHPAILAARGSYVLLSDEAPSGDPVYAAPDVDSDPALRIDGATLVKAGEPWEATRGPKEDSRPAGSGGGPASFRFCAAPMDDIGFPPAPAEGAQAAFIRGTGSLETTVDFGAGGFYAVQLRVAGRRDAVDPIDLLLDDERITSYAGGRDPRLNPDPFTGGRWAYDVLDLLPYTSIAVHAAGPHRVRIVGRGDDRQAVALDDVRIASVDAIFEAGMPWSGEASGQVGVANYAKQVAAQARYAQAFGLRVVSYESGWSVGGDFETTVAESAAKYLDPRAAAVNDRALGVILGAGTTLDVWGTYDLWPTAFESPDRAGRYPLVSSIVAANDRLRPEPTAGQPVPATLRLAEATWAWPDADRPGKLEKAGDLVSYNVVVSKTERLDLVVESAGAGLMRIAVDGGLSLSLVGQAGQPQSAHGLLLTKGLHTVVVQSRGGIVWLRSLSIEPANRPE